MEQLPARIDTLERERTDLQARMGAPDFYKEDASTIAAVLARLEAAGAELETLYRRWDALDSRAWTRPLRNT